MECSSRAVIFSILIVAYALAGKSQDKPPVNEYPYSGHDDLGVKAEWLRQDLFENNRQYGLVMPRVLLPPAGNLDLSSAHQEDGGNRTGQYLAALSFQYAVTGSSEVKKWADETFAAIEILERVTGVDGCVARSFNKSDEPQRHEDWFFFPMEWHQSTSMSGYRWLGDPSSDTYSNLIYGLSIYYDLVADEIHKERVKVWVERVMNRVLESGMRIVDVDGKMTLWGNFSPKLEHENLNSLLGLFLLKSAYYITEDEKYQKRYLELIYEHNYIRDAVMAALYKPPYVPWDTGHFMKGIYILLKYEDDAVLRDMYLASLERYWLKEKPVKHLNLMITYKHYVPEENGFNEYSIELMKNWDGAWRRDLDQQLRKGNGTEHVAGTWMEPSQVYIWTYWMARYHKLLNADNTLGDGTPPEWAKPKPDIYEGMVYVPAGEFIMGSEIGDDDEKPQRRVYVSDFYIDRFEVTNTQYAEFKAAHGYNFDGVDEKLNKNLWGYPDKPVVNISWEEAAAYAEWVGKRLPTEAEWEKAARGIDGRRYPWGNFHDMSFTEPDGIAEEAAWRAGKSPYGAYWMAGGVWEWTADWYKPYPGNNIPSIAYGEKYKVIRGAFHVADPSMQRCSHRYYLKPDVKQSGYPVGFRCVKDIEKGSDF